MSSFGFRGALFACVLIVGTALGSSAWAETPTVKLRSGTLVSPSSAQTYYGASVVHTAGLCALNSSFCSLGRPAAIKELARTLSRNSTLTADQTATNVFEYVRKNIDTEFRYGLSKGAFGALLDQSGTAFDQANLMVELLRQAGVTASYEVGTITLTGADFRTWTGITDAQAACHLLADGGIPAAINGTTSGTCAYSGTVTSVTLSHIWVVANGKRYDPSYKIYDQKAGIDLAAAMGCGTGSASTCGSSVKTAAIPTGTTYQGYDSTAAANYVQNIQYGGVSSQLRTFAANLQHQIEANTPAAGVKDIAGGEEIDPDDLPVAGTSLPYSTGVSGTWTGDIPDQYRSRIRIQFENVNKWLYADETYGYWLQIGGSYDLTNAPASSYPRYTGLFLEREQGTDAPNVSGVTDVWNNPQNEVVPLATSTTTAPNSTFLLTLQVDHPYAASSGAYMDEAFTKTIYFCSELPGRDLRRVAPVYIVQAWGRTGRGHVSRSVVMAGDKNPIATWSWMRGVSGSALPGSMDQQIMRTVTIPAMADTWLAEAGAALDLNDSVSGTKTQEHHTIGIVLEPMRIDYPQTGIVSALVDGWTAMSITSKTNSVTGRQAAFATSSALYSIFEGGAVEQFQDAVDGGNAIRWFQMQNQGGVRYYEATPTNVTSVLNATTNYYDMGFGDPKQQIRDYLTAVSPSFNLVVPKSGTVGAFVYNTPNSSNEYVYDYGPLLAYATDGSAIGYVRTNGYKGGGAANSEPDAVGTAMDGFQRTTSGLSNFQANMATGAVTVSSPSLLTTGEGNFPYALSYQRSYGSASIPQLTCKFDAYGNTTCRYPETRRSIMGWNDNYQIDAAFSSDGFRLLGFDSGVEAAQALAAIWVMRDLNLTQNFQNRVTTIFAGAWLQDQIGANTVTVSTPPSGQTFFRLADGRYNPRPGSQATLLQVGGRSAMLANMLWAWDYQGVEFYVGDGQGASMHLVNDYVIDEFTPAYNHFQPVTWTFADGMKLNFGYVFYSQPGEQLVLTSVSNSAGRSLSFGGDPNASSDPDGYTSGLLVADETNRSISIREKYDAGALFPSSGKVMLPDGSKWRYDYDLTGIQNGVMSSRLAKLYSGADFITPVETFVYDALRRTKTATDAASAVTTYYPAKVSDEKLARGWTVDPLNAVTEAQFNEQGKPVHSIDPLGNRTDYAYDGVGRLAKTTLPEGNSVELTYDVRSNVIEQQVNGKLGGQLSTSTDYVTGPTVFICAQPKLCNKPSITRTKRGKATNYSWDATTGFVSQVQQPADSDGVRPTSTYSYTAMGPSGSQFYRLTSKTETVTPTQNLVTTYAYNSSNKYVLQSSTMDPSGLNLTTSYTFDAVGNLTAINGPRTDVTDVTTYVWDSTRRLTHRFDADPDGAGALPYPAVRNTYDLAGDLTTVEEGKATSATAATFTPLRRTEYAYNLLGLKTQTTVRDGVTATALSVTQYSYDGDHRLQCTAVRMNPAVFASLPASACSLGTAGTDGNDRITRITYNVAGQETVETHAYGTALAQAYVTNTYTDNGKPQTVKDANGNLTTYDYEEFDRLSRMHFPVTDPAQSASSTTDYEDYAYDADDDLTSVRKRDGQVINYGYDDLDRQILKDAPGTAADVYTRYDHRGRPKFDHFVSLTGAGVNYGYDVKGRLTSETDTASGRAMSYHYDQADNRDKVTWPDGVYASYSYDADNRVTYVKENGTTQLALYGYDELGRRSTLAHASSADQTTWGYDGAGRLTSLVHNVASTANDVTFTLARNAGGQIRSATTSTTVYDWTPPGASTVNDTYDGLNRDAGIAAVIGGYDARGNLTNDGTRTLTYDVENRLLSASGSPGMSLVYDPIGRLHQTTAGTTVTQFLYDGDELSAEYDGAGTLLRRYVHGPDVDEPLVWYEGAGVTDKRWLHADMQGSVIFTTNASGARSFGPYKYGPYGEPAAWSGSRFSYTGQVMLPEARLYHYKARAYDPATGRFMQTDPIGYGDDMDLYAYVGEDPINLVDPSGEDATTVDGLVVTGLGGSAAGVWDSLRISGLLATLQSTLPTVAVAAPVTVFVGTLFAPTQANAGEDKILAEIHAKKDVPKDAKDPNGAKAPGKPGGKEGFRDPPSGERWVKNPNGRGNGWLSDDGKVWVPTGQGGAAHGGSHWDVQDPKTGGHINVYPGGRVR